MHRVRMFVASSGRCLSSAIDAFAMDELGATSIEYSLIAALIAVVIITAVSKLGTNLSAKFSGIADNLT